MSAPTPSTIQPGWYPDPLGHPRQRYHDGVRWTDEVTGAAIAGPPPAPQPVGPQPPQSGGPQFAPTPQFAAGPQPAMQHHSADLGPSSPLHYLIPVGRSWQSVLAPWVALFSWLPMMLGQIHPVFFVIAILLNAAAVGLAAWGLLLAKGGGHGTGRSIFALVLGALGLFVGFWGLFVWMM